jgi:type II secretory pathway component GspD/PulD (secretin)
MGVYEVDATGATVLRRLAETIRGENVASVLVEGYSDSQVPVMDMPFSDNRQLSQIRADNVARLLQELSGRPESLFTSIGHGTSRPVATNDTEKGRAANRRVEIRINRYQPAATESDNVDHTLGPGPSIAPNKIIVAGRAADAGDDLITVTFKDAPIGEAFAMLSKKERVNIILGKGISGTINACLYGVTLDEAVHALADTSGYSVKKRHRGYAILTKDEAGDDQQTTVIRTFKIQYSEPDKVKEILSEHKSENGKITVLKDRDLLVVEDTPASIDRIENLLKEIDKQPQQILIEAKILEIDLDETETFGLDWTRMFKAAGGTLSFGMQGFASKTAKGFVAQLPDGDDINFVLNLLSEKGRVHTLSTPKLLALENQEAEVIIGDRQGYAVTTTINQVTSESIEFLESGIILKVIPSVDEQGKILMKIHPEISTGSISLAGIPSQTTTEVTTDLLADNGQPIFIGGLIKNTTNRSREGLPILGDIPVMGRLFSSTKDVVENKETIVLITPYIVKNNTLAILNEPIEKVEQLETTLRKDSLAAEVTDTTTNENTSSGQKTNQPSNLP